MCTRAHTERYFSNIRRRDYYVIQGDFLSTFTPFLCLNYAFFRILIYGKRALAY